MEEIYKPETEDAGKVEVYSRENNEMLGGSVHDRFYYLLCFTVRIGTDLEFPTYDRSLLQPLDWNGFLYGD